MCGRYTLAAPDPAQIRTRFPVGETVEIRRRFNVAPGDDVLAVTADRNGTPRGEYLRWGLIPHWASGSQPSAKMINARVETVSQRPAYRDAFNRFRCLIIADGFYEWASSGTGKRAFHITRSTGEPFAFAGLWSVWRGPQSDARDPESAARGSESEASGSESEVRSCTIITTAANAAVARLHDRMPVILDAEAERTWLDPATPPAALIPLLRPLPDEQTAIRQVGSVVNDARYDGPECLAAPVAANPTLF